VASLAADGERVALVGLLRRADADEAHALLVRREQDPPALVERDPRVADPARSAGRGLVEEPLRALLAAGLLAGGEREDHVAGERGLVAMELEHDRGERGGHRLVVA